MKLLAKGLGGPGSSISRIGRDRADDARCLPVLRELHAESDESPEPRAARFSAMTVSSTCGSLLKIAAFAVLALVLRALLA